MIVLMCCEILLEMVVLFVEGSYGNGSIDVLRDHIDEWYR